MYRSRLVSAIGLVAVWGCAPFVSGGEEGSVGGVESTEKEGASVNTAGANSCSTVVVRGLSEQLVNEMNCMSPGLMESIEGMPGLGLGSAVMPYLQRGAARALRDAVRERGRTLWVNSAYRTLPQQYLLHRWYRQGRCGIYLAARPGRSNHESGLAVDVEAAESWRPTLSRSGFRWLGYSDPVHFDYVGGGRDLRSISVLAFQRLWNRNHPEDRIAEDGDFGPRTESRLSRAPAAGFRRGATCGVSSEDEAPVALEPGPEVPREMMDGCRHVNGGHYTAGGCSTNYQCCGGEWSARGSCGACTCVEPWGTSGCESEVADAGPSAESTPADAESGASCGHTNGGRYRHAGCSASYQCCDGVWGARGACGACACTDAWGTEGC